MSQASGTVHGFASFVSHGDWSPFQLLSLMAVFLVFHLYPYSFTFVSLDSARSFRLFLKLRCILDTRLAPVREILSCLSLDVT